MGPPYWCCTLVHQCGGQNCLREERKIFFTKLFAVLRNTVVMIFNLQAYLKKHFKSVEILVPVTFQITMSYAVSNFKASYI